jgi:hypothetical protein
MNDAPLMAAYVELRELVNADHTPPWVKAACLSLSLHQTKLFCTVPEGIGQRMGPSRLTIPGHLTDR